ncbi:MAG: amidohydrolase [Synergistaceae bacterium]|nr:amidohydrolase [Synergistota bacterium]NLM71199.1 amidohydrolase [Synergistaceae bacterium]
MATLFKDVLILDGEMERGKLCSARVDEGRLSAIGDGLEAGPGDELIDCGGRKALIPGFVNAHTHAAMCLLRGVGEESPLKEWLEEKIWPAEAKLTRDHILWGTKAALLEMAANGVTAFADMYFEMDAVVEASLEAGMRCAACRGMVGDDEEKLRESLQLAETWKDHRDMVTVQLGPHAPYTVPLPMVRRICEAAAERSLGVHFHFLEAEWELAYFRDELKTTVEEYIESSGLLEVPFAILAHCVWLDPEVLDRVDFSHMTVAHNPNSNLKLGSGVMDLSGLAARTRKIALGTDGAASNNRLDVWGEMRCAALLHKGIQKDPTALSARDSLRMATLEGAAGLGFDKCGLIREGWAADLALVDLDRPHYVGIDEENAALYIVYAGSSADVCGTMVAGRWVYRDGEFPTMDRAEIMAKAERARADLLS